MNKTIFPIRSILSLRYIQESYCGLHVQEGDLVITIPYGNPKIAYDKFNRVMRDLDFFDYTCFYCGGWFKQKCVYKNDKNIFCSQKCVDKYKQRRCILHHPPYKTHLRGGIKNG